MPRIFSGRASAVAGHRQVEAFDPIELVRITSLDERPFPVEADGDFVGDFEEVRYGVAPRALAVVA